MGVHKETQIAMYWTTDLNKVPLHIIPRHISLWAASYEWGWSAGPGLAVDADDKETTVTLPANATWDPRQAPFSAAWDTHPAAY